MLLSSDHNTHLNTEISSVHIVSQEQISSLFGIATDFEEFHEIKVLSVDITADSDWRIHLQQIGLALEHLGPHLYDPQRLLFGQATLTIEVLFEKLEVGLAAIVWRTELLFGGWVESRRLDIWSTESVTTTVVPNKDTCIPLHTRSCVLTCWPSSIVCSVKSISGTGFLCSMARWATSKLFLGMLMSILSS